MSKQPSTTASGPEPILLTDRLRLRPQRMSDLKRQFALDSDPEGCKYRRLAATTEADSRAAIRRAIRRRYSIKRTFWAYCIADRTTDELVGWGGVWLSNARQQQATFGYALLTECWGNGYGTEAARALARFAFEDLKVHRLLADIHPDNTASINVVKKLGMRHEASSLESFFQNGVWVDSYQFAMLDREWKALLNP